MRMVDIIEKKRDGHPLTEEEIRWFTTEYSAGNIPDYQASALAMAIYFQGMTDEEAGALTLEMAKSGDQLDLSAITGTKVDKHSTGGVGDKTTFILGPLVAALDVPVAKMSGRGLGHTGGTIDKLEAFTGFETEISQEQFIELVNKNKLALAGQSGNLTPADKKLYALRDVTATVDSIPLIASSVMSKKIAAGSDAIVLDVKTGSGAFMTDEDDARALAKAMVDIGNSIGRDTMAVISDMNQPLGRMIGNALEVKEAVETLKGEGPADVHELSLTLAAHMVVLGGGAASAEEARDLLEKAIQDGSAIEAMKTFIAAQGGDPSAVDDPELLATAKDRVAVPAPSSGYVTEMHAAQIGQAAMLLGAGRATLDDEIDHAVGIELEAKIGHYVHEGDTIAWLHANKDDTTAIRTMVQEAYTFSDQQPDARPLIFDTIH
ncbi:pyrimidine-nucleoside phosphorylase [Salsuginibacillus halophilus]|uniref:Pyrimidine-nucleoside phosphorylase n=1 Tax=Salsuginibacillus halophilus TaxID=517424 RepID=A0A2P8HAQ2_9BACI|nr:pyrimidine-nucleoside phosphorylase [Salsuginibacillus halophilus]PSL43294.1 pyrimidine-nucleoside phosphorylase [Salsuginibacillus halophilus]